MENVVSKVKYEYGDRIRHLRRPEWGVGSVVKVVQTMVNGCSVQSLSVRFPSEGIKVLNTAEAEIERISAEHAKALANTEAHPIVQWGKMDESDWLAPLAQRKVEEAMIGLPADVRDPFSLLRRRLVLTLDLYRFERSNRALMDWAVAQSGLVDPLTHFTRHELEQLFERWARERDVHLGRLLQECRRDLKLAQELDELVAAAPPGAREAVRRVTAAR
ncbi:MAG: DUF3553 domain-containing protein [Planctomycetes bacterium]|nr:DUF3553 domain-containing protein [Planctomycetota bacterium]